MFALLQFFAVRTQQTLQPATVSSSPPIDDTYYQTRMQRATELKERAERLLQALQERKPQRPA